MKNAGEYKNLVIYKPTVLIPYEVRAQIMAFVNGTNHNECQWFHTITRTIFKQGNRVIYSFGGMYIPEQEVAGATVESDPVKGMLGLWKELKEANLKEDGTADGEAVNAIVSKMNVWAHSHVNMACSPSGTDEATFRQWWTQNEGQGIDEPSVMMIVNKREEVYIRVYDPYLGTYFENPAIEISYPEIDTTYVQDALKNKLKVKAMVHHAGFHGQSTWTPGQARVIHGSVYPSGTGYGQNSGPTLVGEADSPGKEKSGIVASSATPAVPTWTRAGMAMMTGATSVKDDLFTVATSNKSTNEALKITNHVDKALGDVAELYIFKCLLLEQKELVSQIVRSPKTVQVPERDVLIEEISNHLVNHWTGHHYLFFAYVCLASRIGSITSDKPAKRIKELDDHFRDLRAIETQWDSITAAFTTPEVSSR